MATVKIKRSAVTATPPTLSAGELAYSELSKKLTIGTTVGTNEVIVDATANNNLLIQVTNNATDITALQALQGVPVFNTINANTDLDSLVTTANYHNPLTATATLALNFPEDNKEFIVEVFFKDSSNVWQRANNITSGNNETYTRSLNGAIWTAWKEIGKEIIDNLTSTDTNKSLSANQGKVLKDILDANAGGADPIQVTNPLSTIKNGVNSDPTRMILSFGGADSLVGNHRSILRQDVARLKLNSNSLDLGVDGDVTVKPYDSGSSCSFRVQTSLNVTDFQVSNSSVLMNKKLNVTPRLSTINIGHTSSNRNFVFGKSGSATASAQIWDQFDELHFNAHNNGRMNLQSFGGSGSSTGGVTIGDGVGGVVADIDKLGNLNFNGEINGLTMAEITNPAPTSGTPWAEKSAAYTAVSKDRLLLDQGTYAITLPASPSADDVVKFVSKVQSLTAVTIDPNGSTINGVSGSLSINTDWAKLELTYISGGWRITG